MTMNGSLTGNVQLISETMKEQEVWKDIPGFEGFYQASNLGHIRSVDRYAVNKRGYLCHYKSVKRVPTIDKRGYNTLWIRSIGPKRNYQVHTLVAMTFLGYTRASGLTINHINGNKSDNRVSNLEVVTIQSNIKHAINTGLWDCRGEKHIHAKFTSTDIAVIREKYANSKISYQELADCYNVGKSTIARIINHQSYKNVH